MRSELSPDDQYAALAILDYLTDLFTVSGNETFTRADVLVILDCVRSDEELFDPGVVIAQQQATADIGRPE
jgi:hypothetical protein